MGFCEWLYSDVIFGLKPAKQQNYANFKLFCAEKIKNPSYFYAC